MKIIVDGKQAVLKEGSSFEYHSENPLFTEAEDYSMDIEFPMKDCPQNILIFGALHVKGVDISTVTFPCEIITASFDKTGILTITEVGREVVKGQFLEGMSQENFKPSADLQTYLTDLNFSAYDGTDETQESVDEVEGEGWEDIDIWDSGEDVKVSAIDSVPGWGSLRHRHIYLYRLVELVSELVGYRFDVSALEAVGMYRSILLVNVVDGIVDRGGYYGYYDLERALPHWTVRKFLDEVGLFFGCLPVVDDSLKTVVFKPYAELLSQSSSFVNISPLDDFGVEMQDGEEKYRGNIGLKLPDDCNKDNVNMCPWFVNLPSYHFSRYNITSSDLALKLAMADPSTFGYDYQIFDITDKGVTAIVTWKKEEYVGGSSLPAAIYCLMEVLNQYGDYREGTELGIVPCPMEIKMVHDDSVPYKKAKKYAVVEMVHDSLNDFLNNDRVPVKPSLEILKDGEPDTVKYYEKLWCVLNDGNTEGDGFNINTRKYEFRAGTVVPGNGGADAETFAYSRWLKEYTHTLSPVDSDIQANALLPRVDESKLYRYKFLSKTLPDPKAIYVIKGKRYACLRLTAHFTVDGMSDLIEGEFYEIVG